MTFQKQPIKMILIRYSVLLSAGYGTEVGKGWKPSKLSHARANTNNKYLTTQMFKQIFKAVKE